MKNLKVIRVIIIVCIALIILIPLLICGGIFILGMLQGIVDIAKNETAENTIVVAENSTENQETMVEKETKNELVNSYANNDTFYDMECTNRKNIK